MKLSPHTVRALATPVDGVHLTISESGQHFERHWHDAYGFGLLDRGGQRWRSRSGSVDAFPGSVINTNPGEVHDGQPLGAAARRWRIVSVTVPVMTSLIERSVGELEIASPVIDDPRVAAVLRCLLRRIEQWSDGLLRSEALAVEESLVESCVLLMSRHGTSPFNPGSHVATLDRVRERLADESRYAPPPSLTELAATAGLSKYQLLRAFRKVHGLPPHAWLLCLRAERARGLISRGSTLAMAAVRAGFADQSHMTRTFRRYYGYTPGAWQRATALKKV